MAGQEKWGRVGSLGSFLFIFIVVFVVLSSSSSFFFIIKKRVSLKLFKTKLHVSLGVSKFGSPMKHSWIHL